MWKSILIFGMTLGLAACSEPTTQDTTIKGGVWTAANVYLGTLVDEHTDQGVLHVSNDAGYNFYINYNGWLTLDVLAQEDMVATWPLTTVYVDNNTYTNNWYFEYQDSTSPWGAFLLTAGQSASEQTVQTAIDSLHYVTYYPAGHTQSVFTVQSYYQDQFANARTAAGLPKRNYPIDTDAANDDYYYMPYATPIMVIESDNTTNLLTSAGLGNPGYYPPPADPEIQANGTIYLGSPTGQFLGFYKKLVYLPDTTTSPTPLLMGTSSNDYSFFLDGQMNGGNWTVHYGNNIMYYQSTVQDLPGMRTDLQVTRAFHYLEREDKLFTGYSSVTRVTATVVAYEGNQSSTKASPISYTETDVELLPLSEQPTADLKYYGLEPLSTGDPYQTDLGTDIYVTYPDGTVYVYTQAGLALVP